MQALATWIVITDNTFVNIKKAKAMKMVWTMLPVHAEFVHKNERLEIPPITPCHSNFKWGENLSEVRLYLIQ